jgi:hypothetical protein
MSVSLDSKEVPIMRVAACGCGALRLECRGAPDKVSLCHCTACQRRTGSSFGIAAFYAADALRISGEDRTYTRGSDGGSEVRFHFCPICGSTVYFEPKRRPGVVAVAVGAFADPDFPAPTQEVYCDSRHAWLPARTRP